MLIIVASWFEANMLWCIVWKVFEIELVTSGIVREILLGWIFRRKRLRMRLLKLAPLFHVDDINKNKQKSI